MSLRLSTDKRDASRSAIHGRGRTRVQSWILVIVVMCLAPFLPAQTKEPKPATDMPPAALSPLQTYRLAVTEQSKGAVTVIDHHEDSLSGVIAGSSALAKRVFTLFSDSVIARMTDSLNAARKMSLNGFKEKVTLAAATGSNQQLVVLHTIAQRSRQSIQASTDSAAACAGCGEGDHVEDRLEAFGDWCDSTRDASTEALLAHAEAALESIVQEYENARDSISERAENLRDEESEEREARADSIAREEEIASRLVITMEYENPLTYRGRDNGVHSSGVSPSVQYSHRTGLFASVSGTWVNKEGSNWDDTETSIGFERSIDDSWYGSLTYTRLWFSSTSQQSKSVLNNILDLEVDWSGTLFSAAAHLAFAFAKTSEATLFLSATAPLTVLERFGGGSLTFEPGLTGTYGQQDASLVTERKQKSNKKNDPAAAPASAQAKPKKIFAVMDYELNLPLNYRVGAFAFGAAYTVVVPLNVVDESTNTVFGVIGVEITMTIR